MFRIFAGGRGLQGPCKGNPPLPAAPPALPLPESRAYEWPEYNKRHFFSPLPPSCEPFFTSLRISGNAMYVCEECVFLCVSVREKKGVRGESTLVNVHRHTCVHALCIMFLVCVRVC